MKSTVGTVARRRARKLELRMRPNAIDFDETRSTLLGFVAHRAVARHDHVADQLRPNRPWLMTPGSWSSSAASAAGSSTGPVQSAITPPSGLGRPAAHDDVPEPAQGRGRAEREQLDRHGRTDALDGLVARRDHDEARGRGRDQLLARVRPPAALDQPRAGRDLVGAVDRDVELAQRLERLDDQAQRERGRLASPARSPRSGCRAGGRRAPPRTARPSSRCRARRACRPRPARRRSARPRASRLTAVTGRPRQRRRAAAAPDRGSGASAQPPLPRAPRGARLVHARLASRGRARPAPAPSPRAPARRTPAGSAPTRAPARARPAVAVASHLAAVAGGSDSYQPRTVSLSCVPV